MKISDRLFSGATIALALMFTSQVSARADVVLAWNEALMKFLAVSPGAEIAPHAQVRACAMMHLAMEQAIVVTFDQTRPLGAPDDLQQAAAISAAREVLVHTLPLGAEHFDALAAAQLRQCACDEPMKTRALAIGRETATVVLRKRDNDNWNEEELSTAGVAALSAPLASRFGAREPVSPWLQATPFMLKSARQFSVDVPYWTDMEGNVLPNAGLSRARIFDAVDRAASTDVLTRFWSESPLIAWNRVTRAAVTQAGLDLASRARVLAVVNLAVADATLASLHWRLVWGSWHSQVSQALVPTADAPDAINIEGFSEPLRVRAQTRTMMIPPVPNFPSTAATIAGAASAALNGVLNVKPASVELPAPDALTATNPAPSRHYSNLVAAARECAYVSSLDGRNCREGCVAGYRLGESIGNYIAKQARTQRR